MKVNEVQERNYTCRLDRPDKIRAVANVSSEKHFQGDKILQFEN